MVGEQDDIKLLGPYIARFRLKQDFLVATKQALECILREISGDFGDSTPLPLLGKVRCGGLRSIFKGDNEGSLLS